ncbi:MAG: hypothetical protein KDI65_02475 [Alphaproteobacteria bacterium]|nr:hypothetical protein [Alphaproteobacteria bacterium]
MAEEQEIFGFEYFMVGVVPVAAPLNSQGDIVGTMTPSKKTGKLEIDMRFFLAVHDEGYDVVRLEKDAFEEACEKYYAGETR